MELNRRQFVSGSALAGLGVVGVAGLAGTQVAGADEAQKEGAALAKHTWEVKPDPITDVACSVGASYRHVFRLLADLCREGVLQKSKQGYQIKCPAELARRAQAGGGTPAPGKANKRKETAP